MRNVSAASLAKLTQKKGTEPVTLIEVGWTGRNLRVMYGDRKFEGVEGRILSVANIEDILNVSKNGTSQTVTITLDDADGALKNIFNQTDIHKKPVWIYQWFTGIPLNEKILIFDGVIATPIQWKESDRTLTFSVISRAEDREVGFSPEEGQFPTLPENLTGTVWPLVFGTVLKLPLNRVDDITQNEQGGDATPTTTEGTGIADPALDPHIKRNEDYHTEAVQLAQLYFVGYLLASSKARRNGELEDFDRIQRGKGPFSSKAKQYLDLGNKWLLDAQKMAKSTEKLKSVLATQKRNELKSIGVKNAKKFPQNQIVRASIGGALHTGTFDENAFHIQDRFHPATEKYDGITPVPNQVTTIPRDNFFWADAGSSIFIEADPDDPDDTTVPIRYIVAATIQVSVLEVYAMRTINGTKSLNVVPPSYYQISNANFGTLPGTILYLPHPLSSKVNSERKSDGWEDDLFATVASPIGPNTVEIMRWLIQNYTNHGVDAASFAEVEANIAAYPSHFALFDRPTVTTLLAEIAYQSRCIIYLKNDIYYLKYLSKAETPVVTITEADIIEQTLSVEYTETEDLKTKQILTWKSNYKTTKQNLVILRYNIGLYGVNEQRRDYFIYNMQQLVEKSGTFWMIREANTFKRVRLTVPIKFLNIETLDTVTLNFTHPIIAYGPINCVVEEASIDTANYTISLVIWCPVRAGEMTQYPFAYIGDLSVEYIFPTDNDVTTGRAGSGNDTGFNRDVKLPTSGPASKPFTGSEGAGGSLHITDRRHTWGSDPTYGPDAANVSPIIETRIDSAGIAALGKKPAGTTKYQLDVPQIIKDKINDISGGVFPGEVVSGEGGVYEVNVYFQGLDNEPTLKKEVYVIQIDDEDSTLAEDTGVFVLQLVYTDDADEEQVEYYIQPAVWQ